MLLGALTLSVPSYGAGEKDQNRKEAVPLVAKFIQYIFGTSNIEGMKHLYCELSERDEIAHFELPQSPQKFIQIFYRYSAIMLSTIEEPHEWTNRQLERLSERVQEDYPRSIVAQDIREDLREEICILISKNHIINEIYILAKNMQIDDPLVFLDPYMDEIFLYVDENIKRYKNTSSEEEHFEFFMERGQDLLYEMVEHLLVESSHIEKMDDFLKKDVLLIVQHTLRGIYAYLDPKSFEREKSVFPMEEKCLFHLFRFRRGQDIYNSIREKALVQGIEFPFRDQFQKKVEEYICSILRKTFVESCPSGGYTLHEYVDKDQMSDLIQREKASIEMLKRRKKKLASLTLNTKASEEIGARGGASVSTMQDDKLMASRSQEENLLSQKGREIRDEAKEIREKMQGIHLSSPLYRALERRQAYLKELWKTVVEEHDARISVSPPSLWRQKSFPEEVDFELLLAYLKEKRDLRSPFSRRSSCSSCSSSEGRWSPRTPSPLTLHERDSAGSLGRSSQSSPSSTEEALRNFWQRRGLLTAGERIQYSLLKPEAKKLNQLIQLTKISLKKNGWRKVQTSVPRTITDLYTKILEETQYSLNRKKVSFVEDLVKKSSDVFQDERT